MTDDTTSAPVPAKPKLPITKAKVQEKVRMTPKERATKFLMDKLDKLSKMPQTKNIELAIERTQDQLNKVQSNP